MIMGNYIHESRMRKVISVLVEPLGGTLTVIATGMAIYGWVSGRGDSVKYEQVQCAMWSFASMEFPCEALDAAKEPAKS